LLYRPAGKGWLQRAPWLRQRSRNR
jgi:hypothetical protein